VTLENAAIVVAYFGALGGPRHARAIATLRGIVEQAKEAIQAWSTELVRSRVGGRAVCFAGGDIGRAGHAAVRVLTDLYLLRKATTRHQYGEVEGIAVTAPVEIRVPLPHHALAPQVVQRGW
jgi:hypothetical protein